MFESIKFYVDQVIDVEEIASALIQFGYLNVRRVASEGDFSRRGEIIDIFPRNFDSPVRIALDENKIRFISSYHLDSGETFWKHKIVIILPKTAREKSQLDLFTTEQPLDHFVDIEKGDYVVHNQHGIGKYLGIERVTAGGKTGDHFVIQYQGGDKLFVPRHDLNLVQKYVGFQKKPPRLFKLGSKEWQAVKKRIQKRLQRTAAELLHLQAVRSSLKGFRFSEDTAWQKEFEDNFPFEETPDQIKAVREVKADMESDSPMDRLLCGDVGFGKTEVAVRAVFKAVMDGKQAAVLVPTTILAEQHYINFVLRMKKYPVKVEMLSRFRSPQEQRSIIQGLHDGNVDVVVGTHRLLSRDIAFKDLGLIVIDEEQRFGVRAKEKLKHLKLLVDVLTMTATPIPRTLYMALSGARDMSVISTPPQNRRPVETHVVEFDEDLIKEAVSRETGRNGQVFFLHNRVEDIEQIAKIIKRLVPQAEVGIAHGQMTPRLLEEVMLRFLKGQINVLVCTTIVESGIDIPNANTLIINRADRFGLAELHQLRGRVGRFTRQAYAYFMVPPVKILSDIAKKRLAALEKYSELGAGFQIAFEDLQIRGAGNLLGDEQSGYIAAIGFDLYCRLLKQSVQSLKKTQML